MSFDGYVELKPDYVADSDERARRLLVVSADLSEPGFAGIASTSATEGEDIWFLIGDHRSAGLRELARLLSVLELDAHHKIMRPGFMPARPAAVFLFVDGELRHGRGRTFPQWAIDEVDRLSGVLLEQHPRYMGQLLVAVRGKPSDVLEPVPDNFVLTDEVNRPGIAGDSIS